MLMIPRLPKHEYLYAHKPSFGKEYIFPLTGIKISNPLTVGRCKVIPINHLDSSIVLPQILTSNIGCVAITTVDVSENWMSECDNYSIALQLTKQSIGAIYLSIYNSKERIDDNRRIVISSIGVHEIDEGLVVCKSETQIINYRNVSDSLFFTDSDLNVLFLEEIENIQLKMIDFYDSDCEYGNKLLKALEILYCINNEIYANERILKICAAMNLLFRQDDKKDFDSPWIASQLHQLFNYFSINIKEKLPDEFHNSHIEDTKYNTLFVDEYIKIRNNYMHGKIELYKEFTMITTTEYLLFISSLMELINIMIKKTEFKCLESTRDFIDKIIENNKNFKNK